MGFNYDRARSTATSLIKRFGQTSTLRQIENAGDEWSPVQVETDTTITAVDLNERVRDNSGTLIGQTMRTLYVSTAAGVTPGKGDKVFVGLDKDAVDILSNEESAAAIHEIMEVRPLSPGGVDVMFEIDLAT